MSCKPTYKGVRYNSLEELYNANGVNTQQAQQLYSSYLQTTNNPTIEGFKQWNNKQQQINELFEFNPELANEVYEAAGFGKESNNIEILTSNYTRQSVQNDIDTLYLFTDNAERTSRPTANEENVDKNSWYYKKYKSQTNKPIHFGSTSNPTSAVIRGLNNAYPISTMSAYGTNWTDSNFELFKQTIDDEISQIKQDLSKFSKLKIGNYRIGQGGLKAKLPLQHQNYLDSKLKELGIDNTQSEPKIIKQEALQTTEQETIEDSSFELEALFEYAESVISENVDTAIETKLKINNFKYVSVDKIQPLDWVEVNGVDVYLGSPKKYYEFKQNNKGIVKKLYNKERDLNPTKITWTNLQTGKQKNIFDLDSVRLIHYIIDYKKSFNDILNGKNKEDLILKAFIEKFKIENLPTLKTYIYAWTTRNTQLIDSGKELNSVFEYMLESSEIDLKTFLDVLFSTDDLLHDTYADFEIQQLYTNTNTQNINNVKHTKMEMIVPNNYEEFNIWDKNVSEIKEEGYKFFEDKLINVKEATKAFEGFDLAVFSRNDKRKMLLNFLQESEFKKQSYNTVLKIEQIEGVDYRVFYNGTSKVFMIPVEFANNIKVVSSEESVKIFILDNNTKRLEQIEKIEKNLEQDELKTEQLKKLREEVKKEKNLYSKFLKSFKALNYLVLINSNNLQVVNLVKNFYNIYDENKKLNLTEIAKRQYASWLKSLEYVASRIPAQSLQSTTQAEVISYHNNGNNIAYISAWMLYIQGADLDIDKTYLMGYSFDNSGLISGESEIELNTKENLDVAVALANISDKKILIKSSENFNTFDKDALKLIRSILSNYNYKKDKTHDFSEFKRSMIQLSHLINESEKEVVWINVDLKENEINLFNKHILPWFHTNFKSTNTVIGSINTVLEQVSNFVSMTSPVDNDDTKDIKKIASPNKFKLLPLDGFTYYEQQRKGAMGSKGVGISANQNKTHLAVSNHLNNWYKNLDRNEKNLQIITPINTKTFHKTLVLPKLVSGSFDDLDNAIIDYENTEEFFTLSDMGTTRKIHNYLKNMYNSERIQRKNSNSMLGISTFISASVDNAKELILEKINAVPELLGMHLYLISIGYNLKEVALFMLHPEVYEIAISTKSLLDSERTTSIENQIKSNINKGKSKTFWKSFYEVFQGAQEFRNLASIYKINQKFKADLDEIYNYIDLFTSTMLQRENFFWNKSELNILGKFQVDILNGNSTENTEYIVLINKILNNILPSNKTIDKTILEEYKQNILEILKTAASNKILKGGFNYEKYISDKKYKKAVIEYYNLIKHSINIFDLVDSVPHFKARIDSFNSVFTKSKEISWKFNYIDNIRKGFSNSELKSIRFDNYNNEFASEESLNPYFFNSAFPIKKPVDTSSKLSYFSDALIKIAWAKTSNSPIKKIDFDLNTLLKDLKTKDFTDQSIIKLFKLTESGIVEKDISSGLTGLEDIEVNLKSDIGIANFKRIMEQLVLPYIKEVGENKEELSDFIRYTIIDSVVSPLGKRTSQISTLAGVNNNKSEATREIAEKYILSFESLDTALNNKRLKNKNNEVVNFKDLLYLYNLFINNEKFGDKSLTGIFTDYIANEIPRDFKTFYNKVDIGEIDPEEIVFREFFTNSDSAKLEKEMLLNELKLFYAFQKRGSLKYTDSGKSFKILKIPHDDFPIAFTLVQDEAANRKNMIVKEVYSLLEEIESNIVNITVNCK